MPGKRAFGTTLGYGTASAGPFTLVTNITALTPFGGKADMMDTTSHDSAGAYREKTSTLLDAGRVQFELNYDDKDTTHRALMSAMGTSQYWQVIYAGTTPKTTDTFQGFVTAFSPKVPFDNKMTASGEIEITGAITRTN